MAKPLSAASSSEVRTITREEFRARFRDHSLVILDVLPMETYAEAHIPGAINLPVAQIEEKARQLIADLNHEIVVYCGGPT